MPDQTVVVAMVFAFWVGVLFGSVLTWVAVKLMFRGIKKRERAITLRKEVAQMINTWSEDWIRDPATTLTMLRTFIDRVEFMEPWERTAAGFDDDFKRVKSELALRDRSA